MKTNDTPTPWIVIVKRGNFEAKYEGNDPEQLLEDCLNQYDIENFPERDRNGGFN